MAHTQKIPWKSLFVEAVAVVVSILLAFAIDAWWEEKKERQDEEEILVALLADFQQAKTRLADRRNSSVIIQNAVNELTQLSYDPDSSPDSASLDQLLGVISWWFPTNQIPTGALNSLVYGGRLSSVQDEKLQLDIADWPRKIDFLQSGLSQDYDVFFEVYLPYFRDNGYLPQIATSVTNMPGDSEAFYPSTPPAPRHMFDHSSVLADKRFHNVLIQMWWVQADAQALIDEVDQSLDVSIQLIETRLEQLNR